MLCTGTKPKSGSVTAAQQLVWRQGRGIANAIIHWLADGRMAIGDWKCPRCGVLHLACHRPEVCVQCDVSIAPSRWLYEEIRVEGKKTGISCGVDLITPILNLTKFQIVEIKTIDKDEFKKLVLPLAEHRVRTKLYVRQFLDSDHDLAGYIYHKAKLLYISKGGWGQDQFKHLKSLGVYNERFSPYKEFEFDVGLGDEDADVLRCEEEATKVKTFREEGVLPDGPCATAFCNRAQQCEVMGACFSGKFPEGKKYLAKWGVGNDTGDGD